MFNYVLHLNFTVTLLIACIFPFLYVVVFVWVLETSHLPVPKTQFYGYKRAPYEEELHEEHDVDKLSVAGTPGVTSTTYTYSATGGSAVNTTSESGLAALSAREKRRLSLTLWPYAVPLCVVYFAEFTMMTGVWSAIGFPYSSNEARARFYLFSGFAYQVGVFISRSSGLLFQATQPTLFLMPTLQTLLLIFFTLVAMYQFWYDWWLLVLCFVAGLLGGGVYVNAYTLISKEMNPQHVEFALTATCLSYTIGIMLADIAGIFLQGCLYSYLQIPGASIPVSC